MDIAPLIRKIEDVDLSIKEPVPPTGPEKKVLLKYLRRDMRYNLKKSWIVYIPWNIT